MHNKFLTFASTMAILTASPAFAENTKSAEHDKSTGSFTEDVEKAWDKTKKDVSEAAEAVSDATAEAYHDAKQALHDDDKTADIHQAKIDPRMTANGMIGQPVYNINGERIAKINDIILDNNGDTMMVVLGDGNFTGLGKLVAFDYDVITKRTIDGDVITALTEEKIDQAKRFSYEPAIPNNDDIRVIPANGYSVSKLLNGELVDPKGETLAEVDNISFKNGEADKIVVTFGSKMGVGGEQAAIPYSEAQLMQYKDNSLNFELSASEAVQFNSYKKKALN